MVVGYALALAQTQIHLHKLVGNQAMKFLPSIISQLSEYLIIPNLRIMQGAYKAIHNLIYYTVSRDSMVDVVEDELGLGGMSIGDSPQLPLMTRLIDLLLYMLKPRFVNTNGTQSLVFKIIAEFVKKVGAKCLDQNGQALLEALAETEVQ